MTPLTSKKPAEHRALQTEDAAAVPVRPAGTTKDAADKAPAVLPPKSAGNANPAPVAALYMTSGYKAASPTKSPSTGLHKPTWKPSSKPAEHRLLSSTVTKKDAKVSVYGSAPTKSPSTGMHKPTWRPSGKPQESSVVATPKDATSPSKSPSTGMHKPTWRPSAKPVESSKKSSSVGAQLPRSLKEKKSEKSEEKSEVKSEEKSEKKSKGEEQVAPLTKPEGPVAPAEVSADVPAKKTKSTEAVPETEPEAEVVEVAVSETKSAKKGKKSDPVAVAALPEGVAAPAAGELLLPPVKNSKFGQVEGTVVAREE
jgi:hypothetical protein